jgi:hypothetical protein
LEWFLFAVIKRLTAGAERFGSVGEIVEWVRKRHLGIRTR